MNDAGLSAMREYAISSGMIKNAHEHRTSPASVPDAVAVPTNDPHEVSARRGWVVLDGERLWTDGLIVVEDGKNVMRFYYGEQNSTVL